MYKKIERFPEPTKRYTMGDYQYQWHLKLNKVLQTTLERLLQIGRGKKNIN